MSWGHSIPCQRLHPQLTLICHTLEFCQGLQLLANSQDGQGKQFLTSKPCKASSCIINCHVINLKLAVLFTVLLSLCMVACMLGLIGSVSRQFCSMKNGMLQTRFLRRVMQLLLQILEILRTNAGQSKVPPLVGTLKSLC
jgi:uncharacterized Tic20 family protein